MKSFVTVIIAVGLLFCGLARPSVAADCATIAADYDTALKAAQVCDPAVADSCAASRPRSLRDVCRCEAAVNPNSTAELDRMAADFKAQSCAYDSPICRMACTIPVHVCTAKDSSGACRGQ
ncbi:MAG TPA: hypothetical protein VMT61_06005 [Candidatus Binataceae bacterium]|nr:hypothetical protein [Candidatus Binataceae bacterium]